MANSHKNLRLRAEAFLAASSVPEFKTWHAATIRHHKDLEQKYRKGAAEPWVKLKPDPPDTPLPIDLDQDKRESDAIVKMVCRMASDFEKRGENTEANISPNETKNGVEEPLSNQFNLTSRLGLNELNRRVEDLRKQKAELSEELERIKKIR